MVRVQVPQLFNFRYAQISESAIFLRENFDPLYSCEVKIEDTEERSDEVIMSYYVYIVECSDKSLYVGCTNNLDKRINQHNNSKWGAHYTKIRRPVVLKYSEIFDTLREARRREAEIKGWRREKKFNLINAKSGD